MLNCFYDCYTILNKVYGDKAYLKQAINSTPIEEKNRSLTVKICYGVLDKDIELSYYITALTEKSPKLVIRTILKIALYNILYLNKHDYAVVKNAVELTKKLGKGGASGFVNAFLRKFSAAKPSLPEKGIKGLSVKYSYPEFIVKELIKDYGEERSVNIMSSVNAKTCLSFLSGGGEEYLKSRNLPFEKTPFDNVYLLNNFVRDEKYDEGFYTYQALGSVAICEGVVPCKNLLDCCAAPGGKSVRLSFKCDKVYSWDIHAHRVELIEEYKRRLKRDNIVAEVKDAKVYDKRYERFFDAVLIDAPCSGTGVINDNPDIKLNRDENALSEIVKESKAIIKTVSNYVKKGGYLYYSTCSVLHRENIEIIRAFLSDVKDFVLCETDSLLPHENIDKTLQFLPDISGGLGFYFAKLKRID